MRDLNTFSVYEFRPLPGYFSGEFRRFANGEWVKDDGEYDLAFINAEGDYSAPICLMVDLPYQKNIRWSWLTRHWSDKELLHPQSKFNPWHYMLVDGAKEWGGDWGRDSHENTIAGRKGMDKICSERSCANGRHVEFNPQDKHILAGLLRERETKRIVEIPSQLICMYCANAHSFMRASAK